MVNLFWLGESKTNVMNTSNPGNIAHACTQLRCIRRWVLLGASGSEAGNARGFVALAVTRLGSWRWFRIHAPVRAKAGHVGDEVLFEFLEIAGSHCAVLVDGRASRHWEGSESSVRPLGVSALLDGCTTKVLCDLLGRPARRFFACDVTSITPALGAGRSKSGDCAPFRLRSCTTRGCRAHWRHGTCCTALTNQGLVRRGTRLGLMPSR